jgi:hypothetical protein
MRLPHPEMHECLKRSYFLTLLSDPAHPFRCVAHSSELLPANSKRFTKDVTGRFLVSALTSRCKVPATLALIQFPSPGSFSRLRLGSICCELAVLAILLGLGLRQIIGISGCCFRHILAILRQASLDSPSQPSHIIWIAFPPMQCFSVRPSRNSMAMKAFPFLSGG